MERSNTNDLNKQVDEIQRISFEYARKADKELAKKLRYVYYMHRHY
jgi:hypothetical protein